MKRTQKAPTLDWFLIGMGLAVGLAWLFPNPGAPGGFLHASGLNRAGLALIFFLYGLSLSPKALKTGLLSWRVHLAVQGGTFLLFPLVGLLLSRLAAPYLPAELDLGFFYLCALPSTVSSSVVMTAVARGNVPAAVFDAGLSTLIGVALTPMWIAYTGHGGGHALSSGSVTLGLLTCLALPLVLGQILRPWLGDLAARHQALVRAVDRGVILVLVYTSFCASMKQGLWSGQSVGLLAEALAGDVVLFFILLLSIGAICDALHFTPEDRIAAVFCGSKKGLAFGVAVAPLIFGTTPALSLILLPLIIYHPFQLAVCGALAGRWARRGEAKTAPGAVGVRDDQEPAVGGSAVGASPRRVKTGGRAVPPPRR